MSEKSFFYLNHRLKLILLEIETLKFVKMDFSECITSRETNIPLNIFRGEFK